MLQKAFRSVRNAKKVEQQASSYSSASSIKTSSSYSEYGGVAKEKVDCVVIGAGVVGLAVARELSLVNGRDVLVIESASTFGTGSSSRNSEVIHAGIYYPPNSLKALLCVRGRELIYRYCNEHDIPHKQMGKLIVATASGDVSKLIDLNNMGIRNGVSGLRLMEGHEAMSLEPQLQCAKALFSPFSGIIDSHSFMLSLLGEAETNNTTFAFNTSVVGGHCCKGNIHLHVSQTNQNALLSLVPPPELILIPKLVVNSAGLSAVALAKTLHFLRPQFIPRAYYARGSYFTLSNTKVSPFSHLIYPIPEDGGLGVHVTLDLNGQLKFGPDVEWLNGIDDTASLLNKFDYNACPSRVKRFYPEIRKYYPNLKDGSLELGYTGIRPKLSGPGQAPVDFVIQGEDVHGVAGLVNLFGIESPGLTSSMAIAEYIATRFLRS